MLLVLLIFGKRNKFPKLNKGLFVYIADKSVSLKPILTSCCSQTFFYYFSNLRNWFISYSNSLSVQAADKKHKTAMYHGKILFFWLATHLANLMPRKFVFDWELNLFQFCNVILYIILIIKFWGHFFWLRLLKILCAVSGILDIIRNNKYSHSCWGQKH